MKIPRVDEAFEVCERHLVSTDSFGTEIDAILTAYVSAVIYSAFEAQARSIIANRGAGDGTDPYLANFSRLASLRLIRSIKIGDLAGMAANFDQSCKTLFHELLDDQAKAAWDSIVGNRHGLAHEDDGRKNAPITNLTFRELREIYPLALTILDRLEE